MKLNVASRCPLLQRRASAVSWKGDFYRDLVSYPIVRQRDCLDLPIVQSELSKSSYSLVAIARIRSMTKSTGTPTSEGGGYGLGISFDEEGRFMVEGAIC